MSACERAQDEAKLARRNSRFWNGVVPETEEHAIAAGGMNPAIWSKRKGMANAGSLAQAFLRAVGGVP